MDIHFPMKLARKGPGELRGHVALGERLCMQNCAVCHGAFGSW